MTSNGSSTEPTTGESRRRFRVSPRAILWVIVLALSLWFIFANTRSAKITFWVHTVTAPIWLVLLCTLLVGMFLGWLASRRRARRR